MKICIVGTGYVGLVTGVCLADFGNTVICVDKDPKRVKSLGAGTLPFYEPGLLEMLLRNVKSKRLSFEMNLDAAARWADILFITVGTPPMSSGEVDVSAVLDVAKAIAKAFKKKIRKSNINQFKIIVNKSTVPVGMGDIVTKVMTESGIRDKYFSVVSNPEFLREGSAIADFLNPNRIVIGASNNRAFNTIAELYRPLNAHIIFTDVKTAELIKYASNAFLATKVSFINEIANICERVKADVTQIADAIGLDSRIGRSFLNAGLGYGGSCLPKDVLALTQLAKSSGYEPQLITAVNRVNELQTDHFITKIKNTFKSIKNKKIAILGLSFKPETDDLREAPSLKIINALQKLGAKISAYDPVAEKKAQLILSNVAFGPSLNDVIKGTDAIVAITEWPEFIELDLEKTRKLVRGAVIFDGRNIFNPKKVREAGFKYYGVGR